MPYTYDPQNIFARILRGEIPNKTVAETPHSLAFHDIRPHAPVHILVIPKGPYVTLDHFSETASAEELADFWRLAARVAREAGVIEAEGGTGYRAIANAGGHSHQEVPHFHLHILGGRPLGALLPPAG